MDAEDATSPGAGARPVEIIAPGSAATSMGCRYDRRRHQAHGLALPAGETEQRLSALSRQCPSSVRLLSTISSSVTRMPMSMGSAAPRPRPGVKFAKNLGDALKDFPEFASLSLYLDESPRTGERLDETAELTPSLKKAAGASALLCAMMSPWYLKTLSCLSSGQEPACP